MSSREYIKTRIDELPDGIVERVREFLSFQLYSLGLFDNDTDYLNSVPGMADVIIKGVNTPVSECYEGLE
ncbi:hypothetical protein FACS1894208_01200 [Clostridia bacterium]|nr:hypothetical protein FACS1894208_01200 [Clostridia bacterium]